MIKYFAPVFPMLVPEHFCEYVKMEHEEGRAGIDEERGSVKRCWSWVRVSGRCRGIQEEYHQMPPRVALADWLALESFLALSYGMQDWKVLRQQRNLLCTSLHSSTQTSCSPSTPV